MGRICKINGIDILRDIDTIMGHDIFNNSAYVYSTSVLTDPYISCAQKSTGPEKTRVR